MNFTIGEKIRIKNTTDKTISLATLRHNFSYDIKPKEFSERLHIDTISAKYLFLKYATLPADKNKYYTVTEEFKERLVGIPLRTQNGN